MRVALVHYTAPPVIGGVEKVLGRHAGLLADAGHEVTVVAARGEATDPRVRFVRIARVDSLDPTIVDLQHELDAGRVPADFGEVRDALAEELAAALAGQDVVICHNVASIAKNLVLTAALHALVTRPGMGRFVLWHHDLTAAQPAQAARLHDGEPWGLLRTAWPDVVNVAISEVRRRELAAVTGLPVEAITVVPNGVDVAALLRLDPATVRLLERFDLAAADPLLLMPVRVMARKNVELGLHVVASMRAAGRSAGLIVAGPADPHDSTDGSYPTTVLALRDSLGLGEAAWFPGLEAASGLPDAVIADLYQLADALFLPSYEEGFGIPLLEAAVFRLPIVCSDLPALREVAGDDALYIRPTDDPADVARRVIASLDADPVARVAGRTRRHSSWEAVYRTSIAPTLERAVARTSRA
ncbi:MAG TPA: glycosyltransferase [Candidatus Limnocylindrales bacterium]